MMRVISIGIFMCAHLLCGDAWAATFGAKAAVERTDPFVGEPFVFQIQVSGAKTLNNRISLTSGILPPL